MVASDTGISDLELDNVIIGGPGGVSYNLSISNGSVYIINFHVPGMEDRIL